MSLLSTSKQHKFGAAIVAILALAFMMSCGVLIVDAGRDGARLFSVVLGVAREMPTGVAVLFVTFGLLYQALIAVLRWLLDGVHYILGYADKEAFRQMVFSVLGFAVGVLIVVDHWRLASPVTDMAWIVFSIALSAFHTILARRAWRRLRGA